jgi:hypothetical protein
MCSCGPLQRTTWPVIPCARSDSRNSATGAIRLAVRSGGQARSERSDFHTILVCANGHSALTRMFASSMSSAQE